MHPLTFPRRLPVLLASAFALALGACVVPLPKGSFTSAPIAAAALRAPPAGPAGDIVRLVNEYRASQGLHALSWNDQLAAAAAAHARDLDQSGLLTHDGSQGETLSQRLRSAGYRLCFAAENLADGFPTPERVVAGWKGSTKHRTNMLAPQANSAGAALSNLAGRPVWVLNVGAGCF